jgi:plasmid stability protein
MAVKQLGIRLDPQVIQQLKLRSAIEGRSVNEIVSNAIREYSSAHPVPRAQMLEMVRAIAVEDAELLKALAED